MSKTSNQILTQLKKLYFRFLKETCTYRRLHDVNWNELSIDNAYDMFIDHRWHIMVKQVILNTIIQAIFKEIKIYASFEEIDPNVLECRILSETYNKPTYNTILDEFTLEKVLTNAIMDTNTEATHIPYIMTSLFNFEKSTMGYEYWDNISNIVATKVYPIIHYQIRNIKNE